jgi:hypothetical protein
VAAWTGVGPTWLDLGRSLGRGEQVTLRFTCLGPGTVKVLDNRGHQQMGISGCSNFAAYGTGWTLKAPLAALSLRVDLRTRWVADLRVRGPEQPTG